MTCKNLSQQKTCQENKKISSYFCSDKIAEFFNQKHHLLKLSNKKYHELQIQVSPQFMRYKMTIKMIRIICICLWFKDLFGN